MAKQGIATVESPSFLAMRGRGKVLKKYQGITEMGTRYALGGFRGILLIMLIEAYPGAFD